MLQYKLRLKLKSALVTPLQSDTIFGQFCWAMVKRLGEDRLEKFLGDDKPAVVFSNGFPQGMLPRPVLEPMTVNQRNSVIEKIKKSDEKNDFFAEQALKKIKKKEWINKAVLDEKKANFNEMVIVEYLYKKYLEDEKNEENPCKEPEKKPFQSYERERNIIDRNTGRTLDEDGIFTTSEVRYKDGLFDIYFLLAPEGAVSFDEVRTLLSDVFEMTGYGADASVGAGHFKVVGIDEMGVLTPPENLKDYRVMSLSNFIPIEDEVDFDSACYKLVTKFGMLGDRLALSGNPYKKPMVMIEAGATFKPKIAMKVFGGLTRNVHPDERIVQNTAAYPYYFKEVREN